ncbi:hypothetical protein PCE1_000787 [Barthelona sp. PCE]
MEHYTTFKVEFKKFLEACVTAQHTVDYTAGILDERGFVKLSPTCNEWELEPGKSYYMVSHESTLFAWKMPLEFGNGSCRLIGSAAHIDSPNLRVKPVQASASNGYNTLNVDKYGGILWSRFLDTVMGCAGTLYRVVDGKVVPELFKIEDAAILPSLAIHLERKPEYDGMNCIPIVSTEAALKPAEDATDDEKKEYLNGLVLELLKKEGIDTENVVEIDAQLYSQAPTKVLRFDDIITSPRLDDLCCAFPALQSLFDTNAHATDVTMMCFFDNEEVGSRTLNGAYTAVFRHLLDRLVAALGVDRFNFCNRSLIASMDVLQATHPGFKDKSDPVHTGNLGKGLTIPWSPAMHSGNTGMSLALLKRCIELYNEGEPEISIEYLHFTNRNVGSGGATMTTGLGAFNGIEMVEFGPMLLGMHSTVETGHVRDIYNVYQLMNAVVRFSKDIKVNSD